VTGNHESGNLTHPSNAAKSRKTPQKNRSVVYEKDNIYPVHSVTNNTKIALYAAEEYGS
jgi:ABC-type taurine transport system ATPase subunit